MMQVKNVFGEYIEMNEEDVEQLLLENKKLVEENEELNYKLRHIRYRTGKLNEYIRGYIE